MLFQHSCEKRMITKIKFETIPSASTFKTVEALRLCRSTVRDNHIWLLEIGTPMPEEFQVINDHDDHVKILPNKRAPVTVEKKKFKRYLLRFKYCSFAIMKR